MSGLMFAGIALGGIHIANAQNNVNSEIDNSRYTVVIPSEVNIDKNTGQGSFAVTGKVKAQSTIDVSIQSKNGYKLKDKNGELPYNIDKKFFSIDNSRSASDIPLNEEFNIASKTNTKVSGYYTDSLTFDITSESYKYRLDVNGNLDDNGIGDGRLDDFGRFDVYLNGKLVKENVEDFCEPIPYGTTWEIKNIRSLDGYRYKDSSDIRTKGVAGDVVEWEGDLLGDTSIYRITYVNLKFYSNKLTINYHADGAQSWKTANVNNASEIDVTGKDIMETEALKYDELYSEDAEKQHFCSIARIKRDGYTAKANTWKVGQKGSLEVQDNKTLQKAQDVAEYCEVLDEFKKNDTTIDLYPIWIPNTYTLTYDLNGGSFNASTTQIFKYGSEDAISSETPIKAGYDFAGWKWGDVIMQPGDKINKGWGNFTLTAQWKKQYTLTFDANGGMISETSRAITEGSQVGNLPTPTKEGYEFYGWYTHPQSGLYYIFNGGNRITEDTTVVAYWGTNRDNLATENKNALSDGTYKIFQIQDDLSSYCFSPRFDNDDSNNPVLLKKDNGSEYALWEIEHDEVGYVLFKNKKTGMYLDLNSAYAQSGQEIQLYKSNGTYAQKWIVIKYGNGYKIVSACNPSFVIDLSGADLKDDGNGHLNSWIDNGTLAQRWNFKRVQ